MFFARLPIQTAQWCFFPGGNLNQLKDLAPDRYTEFFVEPAVKEELALWQHIQSHESSFFRAPSLYLSLSLSISQSLFNSRFPTRSRSLAFIRSGWHENDGPNVEDGNAARCFDRKGDGALPQFYKFVCLSLCFALLRLASTRYQLWPNHVGWYKTNVARVLKAILIEWQYKCDCWFPS